MLLQTSLQVRTLILQHCRCLGKKRAACNYLKEALRGQPPYFKKAVHRRSVASPTLLLLCAPQLENRPIMSQVAVEVKKGLVVTPYPIIRKSKNRSEEQGR